MRTNWGQLVQNANIKASKRRDWSYRPEHVRSSTARFTRTAELSDRQLKRAGIK